ncbi:MAG: FeoA family protein [Candidatus Krumholzibacteria bacterium]|nr:FeoA family protein [Candidatus Krumholzibacteria bacterium]
MRMTDLAAMHAGESGTVTRLDGGTGASKRLEDMGIRPGVRVTKISGQIMHGPVIVGVGSARLAIGHGMARRVVVAAD